MRRLVVIGPLLALVLTIAPMPPARAAVPVPVTIAPDDDATLDFPVEPPLFRWQPVAGASSYRIEIDDAPDFIGALTATTVNTAYTLTNPQTIGQPFYWHVQAVTGSGSVSDWSPVRSYDIAWPGSQPILISPGNGDTVEDIVLTWNPVPGAATYQLQVSPNGDWANNVVLDTVVKSTTYSPPTTLDNASYFWRVRARDSASPANLGSWSEEWQFTRQWPQTPTLVSPADSVGSSVETPTLTWTPIRHASHYEVQIGTDVNFSPTTYWSCFTNHTTVTYYETVSSSGPSTPGGCSSGFQIEPGMVYAWRVRGVDAPGGILGPWSDVHQFLFRGSAVDIPDQLSPADGSTVEVPTLTWSSVPDIERYRVTIRKPGGSTVSVTTYANSWTPTGKLASSLPAGPFDWWVQTVDAYGNVGVKGDEWSFNLDPPSSPGATESLLSPANGSSSVRMPSMSWTPVTDATYYEVWYSVSGSGVEFALSGTTDLPYTAFSYASETLTPGTYAWRVKAYGAGATLLDSSTSRTFTITTAGDATYGGPCTSPQTPCVVDDTPTLTWTSVPQTGLYLVYIAQDASFTNIQKTYRTQYTTLTPRESLLDNQAGKSYFWFVRPCTSHNRCGPFDASVFPQAFAFQKESNAVAPLSPADTSTVADLVTFSWVDYLDTNQADADTPTQEAKQYRIQVSTVADFATILDEKTVDQTTFTPYDRTYPEGTLYWRVQAIDGSGNALTRSPVWTVVKSSPKISLQEPAADVKLVANLPYFRWTPQDYAARYEIEVYKNGDTLFSPSNKVLSQQTKAAAWAPTNALPVGVYAWRLRRLDADGKAGPWSNPRKFSIVKQATTTTVSVTKANGKIKASGTVTPPVPGVKMTVTLLRKQGGSFVKLATTHPAVKLTGGFATSFSRPSGGTCKVVAVFPGDGYHKKSQDSTTFSC